MSALFRNVLHHNGVVFRLNVLAIGQDGHFDLKSFDGSAWSADWDDHGAGFADNPPTGVQWAPNSLAAMAIDSTGSLQYKYNVGAGWSQWNDFGGVFQGRPAAVGRGRNRLDLFARGPNNRLYHKAWNGSTLTSWGDLGVSVASDPAAISWEGNRLSVAVLGTAGNILYRYNINGTWSPGWTDMGRTSAPGTAIFAHAPTMVSFGGNRLAVFAVDTAGRAWVKHWDGTSWYPSLTGWVDLGRGRARRPRPRRFLGARRLLGLRRRCGRPLEMEVVGRLSVGTFAGNLDDLGGSLIGEPRSWSTAARTSACSAARPTAAFNTSCGTAPPGRRGKTSAGPCATARRCFAGWRPDQARERTVDRIGLTGLMVAA